MKTARCLSICMLVVWSLLSGKAEAANWERISEYEDTIIYVNNESVRHISETVVGAQFKIVFKEPSWVRSKSLDYYLIQQENNCREKKYKVYQVTVYFKDDTNETFKRTEEHEVNPDTFQSVIDEFMCKKTK